MIDNEELRFLSIIIHSKMLKTGWCTICLPKRRNCSMRQRTLDLPLTERSWRDDLSTIITSILWRWCKAEKERKGALGHISGVIYWNKGVFVYSLKSFVCTCIHTYSLKQSWVSQPWCAANFYLVQI